jgi:hypothetical protein
VSAKLTTGNSSSSIRTMMDGGIGHDRGSTTA